jgi:hypothetical protein
MRLPVLSGFFLLLVACGSPQTPTATFQSKLDEFHGHMRWGRFNEAATFLQEEDRQDFLGAHDELGDDYQVTEFEIQNVIWDDRTHARVTVWIQSYQLPSTRVDEVTWEESWEYEPILRRWQVTERREID